MQKKLEISEYRERLHNTLASTELTNQQTVKTLFRNQLKEECNEDTLDQRVTNLSSILDKLRSVSTKDQESSKSSNDPSYGDWKTIGSVAKSEDYNRILADPLHIRINQALYSNDKTDERYRTNKLHGQERRDCEEKELKLEVDELDMRSLEKENDPEIKEQEECVDAKEEDNSVSSSSEKDENVIGKTQNYNGKTRFCLSPEVKQALGILERVISMVRKSKTFNNKEEEEDEEEEEEASSPKLHLERIENVPSSKICIQDPIIEVLDEASFAHYLNNNSNRRSGSSSFAREGNKIAHASPEIDLTATSEVTEITISQATTLFSKSSEDSNYKLSSKNCGNSLNLHRKRKPGCFCCM